MVLVGVGGLWFFAVFDAAVDVFDFVDHVGGVIVVLCQKGWRVLRVLLSILLPVRIS
jgi:hypothetical protein